MTSYTLILDVFGAVRVDQVRRDDGVFVRTGRMPGLGGVVDDPDFADPDGLAYRAWLAAGNAPGAPAVDLRGYSAAARYTKETAGITVGNAPIATDRDSQDSLNRMWAAAQMNPAISVSFKSLGGFVTINAAQIQTIAAAVVAHVQACFAAEMQIDADIASGKVTTPAQVDAVFAALTA